MRTRFHDCARVHGSQKLADSTTTVILIVRTAVFFMIQALTVHDAREDVRRWVPRGGCGWTCTGSLVVRSEAVSSGGGMRASSALHCVPHSMCVGLQQCAGCKCVSPPSPACLSASLGSEAVLGWCVSSCSASGSGRTDRRLRSHAPVLFVSPRTESRHESAASAASAARGAALAAGAGGDTAVANGAIGHAKRFHLC